MKYGYKTKHILLSCEYPYYGSLYKIINADSMTHLLSAPHIKWGLGRLHECTGNIFPSTAWVMVRTIQINNLPDGHDLPAGSAWTFRFLNISIGGNLAPVAEIARTTVNLVLSWPVVFCSTSLDPRIVCVTPPAMSK